MATRSAFSGTVVGQVFPWDLADDPRRADAIADAGITAVAIAVDYHAVRTVQWQPDGTPSIRVSDRSESFFAPMSVRSADERCRAPIDATGGRMFDVAVDSARDAGLEVRGWFASTHFDAMSSSAVSFATEDAWGNRSPFTMCDSWDEVTWHSRSLIETLASETGICSSLIESIGYLGFAHGCAHDKTGLAGFDRADELLLSACFCCACLARGEALGFDLRGAREAVRTALYRRDFDDVIDILEPVLRLREANVARSLALLSHPVGDQTVAVTAAAAWREDEFSSYSPVISEVTEAVGRCFDLTARGPQAEQFHCRADSAVVAGVLPISQRTTSLNDLLGRCHGALNPFQLDEIYLYHVGIREPSSLSHLAISTS